ncbi:MAG: hypothetical protein WC732_08975 [Candidatus Omnitrophota bacterium]
MDRAVRTGLAMVNMLIFMIVFTILSGIVMTIASSSTRSLESHIRRNKAYFASEGAIVLVIDGARRSISNITGLAAPLSSNVPIPWSFTTAGTLAASKNVFVTRANATAPMPTTIYRVNGSMNYSQNW